MGISNQDCSIEDVCRRVNELEVWVQEIYKLLGKPEGFVPDSAAIAALGTGVVTGIGLAFAPVTAGTSIPASQIIIATAVAAGLITGVGEYYTETQGTDTSEVSEEVQKWQQQQKEQLAIEIWTLATGYPDHGWIPEGVFENIINDFAQTERGRQSLQTALGWLPGTLNLEDTPQLSQQVEKLLSLETWEAEDGTFLKAYDLAIELAARRIIPEQYAAEIYPILDFIYGDLRVEQGNLEQGNIAIREFHEMMTMISVEDWSKIQPLLDILATDIDVETASMIFRSIVEDPTLFAQIGNSAFGLDEDDTNTPPYRIDINAPPGTLFQIIQNDPTIISSLTGHADLVPLLTDEQLQETLRDLLFPDSDEYTSSIKSDIDEHVALAKWGIDEHTSIAKGGIDEHVALAKGGIDEHVALAKGSIDTHVSATTLGVVLSNIGEVSNALERYWGNLSDPPCSKC